MVKLLCDICGQSSACVESVKVKKKQELEDFDSTAYNFYDQNRNFFSNQILSSPYKPIRSVDTLTYNNGKKEIALIEIKKASANSLTSYLEKLKEKYIDTLFILSHLYPGKSVKKWTIAIPDNNAIQINRIRSSLAAYFSRTQNIDDAYYFSERGHLFSPIGKRQRFCYPPSQPFLKRCWDAL